ncbi:MAG: LPS export ABC transporter periplasmic protein LptC [Gammaproteobacteria bacterium]|nr:LPS export ABC transporter periplasmic protein LptC [Gammaproteobacteria bacterium]MDE0414152.1 LPS export ABC transporter periplasmic protein LptC [Gammaproteobacteria bacterium]
MSRLRRHVPALLLLVLALASLLLGFRTESVSGPEQASLAGNYFFRDARMTLAGEDGRAALVVTSGSAVRSLTGTALRMEPVSIRQSSPQAWALAADSAEMPGENADIVAQGGLRMTFGPAGDWAATARRATIPPDGTSITLTGDVHVHKPEGGAGGSAIFGEHIILEPRGMTARTDQPVRLRVGDFEFEANGLDAQIGEQVITLESDVRSIANP